jgi:hypothetical protein
MRLVMCAAPLAALVALAASFAPAQAQQLSSPGCGNGVTCATLAVASQSVSYTVGSGGTYATVSAALSDLSNRVLSAGSSVTLTLLDGVISEPSYDLVSNPFGNRISIQGQNTYSFSISSVQSSSGSAGAWSYVLNLNTVANISVGDYLTIYATSGGANPSYIAGVWPVTAVDGVNKRVTLTTTGRQAAAASGAVIGTAIDMKSILKFTGTDGIRVWNGATGLNIGNFNIVGDGTTGTSGLSIQDVGRLNVTGPIAVSSFGDYDVMSIYNSQINTSDYLVASSAGKAGIVASGGGTIDASHLVSTGNATHGVQALVNGSVQVDNEATASGNGGTGLLPHHWRRGSRDRNDDGDWEHRFRGRGHHEWRPEPSVNPHLSQ